jgi:hypothetical protein
LPANNGVIVQEQISLPGLTEFLALSPHTTKDFMKIFLFILSRFNGLNLFQGICDIVALPGNSRSDAPHYNAPRKTVNVKNSIPALHEYIVVCRFVVTIAVPRSALQALLENAGSHDTSKMIAKPLNNGAITRT